MRRLTKAAVPQVLLDNHDSWLAAWLDDKKSVLKRCKYRHPDIKKALKAETSNKCIYCESVLGVTAPGQTEHIVPSSKDEQLHFTWENLTRACAECNRRKNDYFQIGNEFINPYVDDVDLEIVHFGPQLLWRDGSPRAEASIRMLGLHGDRHELMVRKCDFLVGLQTHYDRMLREVDPLREVLRIKLMELADPSKEYSGMVRSFLASKGVL